MGCRSSSTLSQRRHATNVKRLPITSSTGSRSFTPASSGADVGERRSAWLHAHRSINRLLARPVAPEVDDLPIVLLRIGEVGMAAFELGWGRRRLGHRGTRFLGCGYRFVDLLGSID